MAVSQQFNDRVGEVRPSQLLSIYGIGSVVDLQKTSAVVLGLDDWPFDDTQVIEEPRLLDAVRSALGRQVTELRTPPKPRQDVVGRADQLIGVPVATFPRWVVCPYCRLLAPVSSGAFQLQSPAHRSEEASWIHGNCPKAKGKTGLATIPARFLMACPNGHLDDFPWVAFVHDGEPCPNPRLRLEEVGASGEAFGVRVECKGCGQKRLMSQAFGESPSVSLEHCSARRPHLRDYDPLGCSEKPKPVLLGASNIWFSRVYNVLSIPAPESLRDRVVRYMLTLNAVDSKEALGYFLRFNGDKVKDLADDPVEDIWDVLIAQREATNIDQFDETRINVKVPEWSALTSASRFGPERDPDDVRNFLLREVSVPKAFSASIESLVLVERLREVAAFVGFNRIRAANDFGETSGELGEEHVTPLRRQPPTWVPANDMRGEGVFIRFREETIRAWEERVASSERITQFHDARKARLIALKQLEKANEPDPGLARRVLLHSLSHALMREFSLESGYGAASLKERIYSMSPAVADGPMAGILIYTSASDSEGTLGGLVSLGETQRFGELLQKALRDLEVCASDPLCSEHEPDLAEGSWLHGAACHACLYAPETSCEMRNQWLDRAVLIETFGRDGIEFYSQQRS